MKVHSPLGVVIYWKDDARLRQYIEASVLPTHNLPQFATIPGSMMVVATQGGRSLWCFRIGAIEPTSAVRTADGAIRLQAHQFIPRGRIRSVRQTDPFSRVSGSQWLGAIRYFDEATGAMLRVQDAKHRVQQMQAPIGNAYNPYLHPLFATTAGSHLCKPEAELVEEYVRWTNNYTAFAVKAPSQTGGEIDLYISKGHTIVEAKAHVHREDLRMAVGQLLDYRRGFERTPRLAILLPAKPDAGSIEYLRSVRVTIVWREKRGGFVDTERGRLTSAIRMARSR